MTAAVDADPGDATGAPHTFGIGPMVSGALASVIGAGGVGFGIAGIFGGLPIIRVPWLLPLVGVCLHVDALGGFFMVITGAVSAIVGVYWIGYAHREHLGRTALTALPVFVAALLLVAAAGSVTTFLYSWELMAVASLMLLLAAHRRDQVRSAAVVYAVMTQLGFAALLLGMMMLAAAAHADVFTEIGPIPERARTAVFLLTFAGFGSKAGLLPLHAWLPKAHPEAPSAVSALMSAAMVNLGVYGIIRIALQLLGPAPRWWGMLLMVVGGASAIYGVLQASVATDLKRLLAYSTTENMGLIVLAIGVATLMAAAGAAPAAGIAVTAALMHLLAHAAFKSLGFLASGSVLVATGLRDLNRLGGLARRMPLTTVLFGVSALGGAGLPLGAGFVSEWLLVQSLIHTGTNREPAVALAAPVAVAAVALTAGLGVATMVKAFGIGFLARPRSDAAAHAREAPGMMIIAMTMAAAACTVLAIAPGVVADPIDRVFDVLPGIENVDRTGLGLLLRLPGVSGSMGPGLLAAALAGAVVVVLIIARWRSARRPETATLPLWACGAGELSSRMQYTATSFAQPLQRVFHDVLRPETDVAVMHVADSHYLVERIEYRVTATDIVEDRLHLPVLRVVAALARSVRAAHNGSVHLYLTYGAVGVLIVLLVAAR